VQGITPDVTDSNKMFYSAILNQLYIPGQKDLLQMTLTIKGDPYWLGSGFITNPGTNGTDANGNALPFYYKTGPYGFNEECGEHMFIFSFNFPSGYDNLGQIQLKQAQVYSGCYTVLTMTAIFSAGRFTQELYAVRDARTIIGGVTYNYNPSGTTQQPISINPTGGAGGAF
jgi:hypothetical protein